MPEYLHPGVYVQEVDSGAHIIQPVGTSTACFIGEAAQGPAFKPTLVQSFMAFEALFGGIVARPGSVQRDMPLAVQQFFANGGSTLYVVRVVADAHGEPAITLGSLDKALVSFDSALDIQVLAVPGVWQHNLLANVTAWARKQDHMMLLLDGPGDQHNTTPASQQIAQATSYRQTVANNPSAALYFPWVEVADPYATVPGPTRFAPPSGFMAGVLARTDQQIGVWKAPAGTSATLATAVGLAVPVSDAEQGPLNAVGINVIRSFDAIGIVCWGARTLAPPSSAFTFLSVRRLMQFVQQSLTLGTQWVVFEPNNPALWAAVCASVAAFMHTLFVNGALQGSSAEEAYFVQCDSSKNAPATIAAGELHLAVGLAPLRPAEFVIVTLTQPAMVP